MEKTILTLMMGLLFFIFLGVFVVCFLILTDITENFTNSNSKIEIGIYMIIAFLFSIGAFYLIKEEIK